jgi:hypothetical protein
MPAPLAGQVAVSGTAQQLSAPIGSNAFTIKASTLNAHSVFVGPQTVLLSTGFELSPGDTFDYERSDLSGQPRFQLNVSDFWVIGTSGDMVSWLASP